MLKFLRLYDFPGNVRELENAIEHASVICKGSTIEVEHLPDRIVEAVLRAEERSARGRYGGSSEESIIREALARNQGNRVKTAEELGMHRSTLWRKISKYRIAGS